MKIPTNLLQAIAVAVTLGTTSACTAEEEKSENCDETCMESCLGDHPNKNEGDYEPCIACGMG